MLEIRGGWINVVCVWCDDHDIVYLCGAQREYRTNEHGDPRGGRFGDRVADLHQRDADHVVGLHADRQGLRIDREAVKTVCTVAQTLISRRRGGFGRVPLYLDEHQRQSARIGQCRHTARDQGNGGVEKA